jgi:hypothetical protein
LRLADSLNSTNEEIIQKISKLIGKTPDSPIKPSAVKVAAEKKETILE